MSPAVTPPPSRRRSPLWYVTVFSLVVIVGLLGVFGALHWYVGYARTLGPTVTVPRVLDKKAEKPSGGAKAGTGDQADTSESVGSHKANAKPTVTPGA